jgi:hypothetical protein
MEKDPRKIIEKFYQKANRIIKGGRTKREGKQISLR